MIAFALIASLVAQDTTTALSPRVHAMLGRFPPPRPGVPSIAIGFSRDTAWVGEQIELATVTWFPRPLRDQLRRLPVISAPALTGLWSAHNQQRPIPAGTRMVGNQVYDLYVSWQTIFPLGAGRVVAPAATLTYNLPTSTAYFAPEERKTFRSATATVVVRPIPAALVAPLGSGPTAHDLRLTWRGPVTMLRAGSPAAVELVIVGDGNITLWPTPAIHWPASAHVYPEPTIERLIPAQGLITGEKHFRFTVVADSAGVLTLPPVRYPYFDPASVQVVPAAAASVTLPILERSVAADDHRVVVVVGTPDVPAATSLVNDWWALLLGIALLPFSLTWYRSRRPARAPASLRPADPEKALRLALGTPVDAGPDHVIAALRSRGVPKDEAEHMHRWLSAVSRRRYGPNKAELPDPPPMIARVLARLRASGAAGILMAMLITGSLLAQAADGMSRFAGGDFAGASRAFAVAAEVNPEAAGVWRDLGAARWMQHDDVGAAAAWLYALSLAPRDQRLRDAWNSATGIPPDVRARAPSIPLSRDEAIVVAVLAWLVAGCAIALRWRRGAMIAGALCAASLALAGIRSLAIRDGQALVAANATLHISPHPATAAVGELPAWSTVRIGRRTGPWVLIEGQVNPPGAVAALTVQGWVPAASVVPIGPLD